MADSLTMLHGGNGSTASIENQGLQLVLGIETRLTRVAKHAGDVFVVFQRLCEAIRVELPVSVVPVLVIGKGHTLAVGDANHTGAPARELLMSHWCRES